MNRTILSILILGSTVFSGCSSHNKVDRLSSDIQTMNTKIENLSNEMNTLQADVQSAQDDATRANQRLDNQVSAYRK